MKITKLTTFRIRPRWLFLRVDTDEGIVGWGEPGGEARVSGVEAAVHELADYLVGENPLAIERLWQVLSKSGFARGGAVLSSAISGIDQALWDIAGKAYEAPVYDLLGGPVRERMRVYACLGADRTGDYGPEEIAQEAVDQVARGFTAVKMNASSALERIDRPARTLEIVGRAAAVRDAIGFEQDFAIDCHGRVSKAMAKRLLPLLEPYHPLFVEEPVLAEYPEAYAELAQLTSVPIATGERLYHRMDFQPFFAAGLAVAQPDPSHAGGISETRRIAAVAETYDVAIALHSAIGPIALAACLQVDFATPNALIQEQGIGYREPGFDNVGSDLLDYLVDRSVFACHDGFIARPSGPGLGIEVDEAAVEHAAEVGHSWRLRPWTHGDGSYAER
jgi:galactonate dehydratase